MTKLKETQSTLASALLLKSGVREGLGVRLPPFPPETRKVTMVDIDDVLGEMREEGTGSRGRYYEAWGSGIRELLVPLADLLEASKDEHPELVNKVATGLYRGYL